MAAVQIFKEVSEDYLAYPKNFKIKLCKAQEVQAKLVISKCIAITCKV